MPCTFFKSPDIQLLWATAFYRKWFLAVAEAEGEGGKTSALEVKAKGEAEGLVFCI